MKRIAFVVPWFAKNIPGGAEAACRDIAYGLSDQGFEIEILTTCIKQFSSDWNINYYKEGIESIDNIKVRRFKVEKRDVQLFDSVNYKLMNKMQVTHEEEKIFIDEMIKSPKLYEYIAENKEKYSCFIFIPYMFSTTYYGIKACPEKSILIPCLHDESYAYLQYVKEMFGLAKRKIFLSKAEEKLASELYKLNSSNDQTIGIGVEKPKFVCDDNFIEKYNIQNPYILYAGRKDKGKGVDVLLSYFERFVKNNESSDLALVLIGGGEIEIPTTIEDRVFDLGYVSSQDKYNAYSNAKILCQPSFYESFSIVIMESWLYKTPVIVNGKCEVTKNFCIESKGGLYFNNYYEFEEIIKLMIADSRLYDCMVTNGYNYVAVNFMKEVVIDKYKNLILDFCKEN